MVVDISNVELRARVLPVLQFLVLSCVLYYTTLIEASRSDHEHTTLVEASGSDHEHTTLVEASGSDLEHTAPVETRTGRGQWIVS